MMEESMAKQELAKEYIPQADYLSNAANLFFLPFYQATYQLVDQCCIDLAIEAFQQLDETIIQLCDRTMVSDHRAYTATTIVDLLNEEGLITFSNGKNWEPYQHERWKQADCLSRCQQGIQQFPQSRGMFELIALAREGIIDFLQAKKTGLDVLFPKDKASVWYRYNNDNAIIQVYAKLVAAAIQSIADEKPGLRLLEVGAGTGASTAEILNSTCEQIDDYLYTDLGVSFLRQGQARFEQYPFMRYQRLDINHTLLEQGIDAESMDIVLAMNVVHTATDIEMTLRYLKTVLKPGGWLVLGEGSPLSAKKRWRPDIVFGLLQGWWDVKLSPHRPRPGFLLPNEWCRLLEDTQFTLVNHFPGEAAFGEQACYGGVVMGRKNDTTVIDK